MKTPAIVPLEIPENSQPLTGIRPGKTTKNRDNDESQPLPVITINQSQLLSGIDSNPSQPKSGNDTLFKFGWQWTSGQPKTKSPSTLTPAGVTCRACKRGRCRLNHCLSYVIGYCLWLGYLSSCKTSSRERSE